MRLMFGNINVLSQGKAPIKKLEKPNPNKRKNRITDRCKSKNPKIINNPCCRPAGSGLLILSQSNTTF
jgi:hypothetical protein